MNDVFTRARPTGRRPRASGAVVLGAGALLTLIAALGLYAWTARARAHATAHWHGQLRSMADDRAAAIEGWTRERLADARTVAAYPTVGFLASGRRGPPYPFPRDAGAESHVVELFRKIEAHYGYDGSWLVGPGPAAVLARTTVAPLPEGVAERARDQAEAFVDFRHVDGLYRVVVAAPVWPGEAGEGRPVGAVVLAKDPGREIFGLLRREPVPTRTGETLLVRRDGPGILFLSPLRHLEAPPGTVRLPLATAGTAAAAAVEGREVFGTFTDHRGVTVLAAVTPLREAPQWSLVAKIDRDEALEATWAETRSTALAAGGALLALAGVAFGLSRHQAASARLALARSEARFAHLLEHAADAVFFIRPDGAIARVNQRAEEMYGYSRDELQALRVHDLYPPDKRETVGSRMEAVRQRPGLVFETEQRARDGTPRPVEVASRYLETDEGGVFVSIVRDIRERKAAEARIAFLNQTLRTLSEINQLMVRETDPERLMHEACHILVEHGGFRMAWIGFRDPQTEWIVPVAWAGHEDGYLSETWFSTDESSPHGQGPTGEALRHGQTTVVADVEALPHSDPWREARLRRGYRSVAVCPIGIRGEVRGALALYSAEPGVFVQDVLGLVEELAGDVGFALDAIDARREREEAVAALVESRGFLQTLVDSSSAAIFIVRPDGRVGEVWNPAAERMFGWAREEVVGEPLPIVDAEHQDEFRALREQVLAGRRIAGVEVSRVRRDGTAIALSLAASPLRTPDGGVSGILAVALDVTERARAERSLRQLSAAVEQSPVAIMITDTHGRIEYVNPAFTRHSGYSREEAIGQNPRILKSGHHPPEFYAEMYAALARGEGFHAEMLNRRKDGGLYWERATISAIVDAHGRISHYLAVKEDVTEHRRAEEVLRQTQEQLAQSQKLEAVGRLAGGIAHDFNNLLGVIIGHGELAEPSLSEGNAARRRLSHILDAARRGAELTRQLLAFSRQQLLRLRVLDLNTVVGGMESMLRRLIGEDVRLVTDLAPSLGRVRVDPGQMTQVLMNLAVNARDAMPRGGTLRIETSDVDVDEALAAARHPLKPGPYVQLVVSDDGAGMDEAVRAHAFEPFFTTKPEGAGSGLGLATVYGIVKHSGGYVWLDSAPGAGTRFTIHLPRVDDPVEEAPAHRLALAGGSETILVVEDLESLRELLGEILSEAGYRVLSAADGLAALAMVAAHPDPIHLLATDLIMPGMNGRELLDRVREQRPQIRALFISGYTSDVIARSGARVEGTHLLEKPFGRDGLLRAVREALATPSLV